MIKWRMNLSGNKCNVKCLGKINPMFAYGMLHSKLFCPGLKFQNYEITVPQKIRPVFTDFEKKKLVKH